MFGPCHKKNMFGPSQHKKLLWAEVIIHEIIHQNKRKKIVLELYQQICK
jgi:hypothetical protein